MQASPVAAPCRFLQEQARIGWRGHFLWVLWGSSGIQMVLACYSPCLATQAEALTRLITFAPCSPANPLRGSSEDLIGPLVLILCL